MKQIECPICHEVHDENVACPRCSFECHYALSEEMAEKFKKIETERINKHIEWWNEQQQHIIQLNNTISEKEQVIVSKQKVCDDLNNQLKDKKKECDVLAKDLKIQKEKGNAVSNTLEAKKKECNVLEKKLEQQKERQDALSKELKSLLERIKELENMCENCPRPQRTEPKTICYLIHKEGEGLRDVHPIYKGETVVGKNPNQGEKLCRITTGCKEMQNNHFKIVEQEDGTINAIAINRIALDTPSDVVNPGSECPLDNSTTIYIGNVQLIVILQ